MNSKNSLVSIIIPVYNVAPYLADALDSVLKQTYKDLEIIIIDDGSTDGSEDICDKYAATDDRIILIHQHNKGLSGARNSGLNVFTGDYVAFLDSDDVLYPDYISSMLTACEKTGSDIAVCKYLYYGQRSSFAKPLAPAGSYDRINALHAIADGSIDQVVWNKLYRRHLWQSIRFPEGQNYEDLYVMYRIFDICSSVCVIDSPLYLFRKHPGSITATNTLKNIYDRLLAAGCFKSYVKANIPGVFTSEHLLKREQIDINYLVSQSVRAFWSGNIGKDSKAELRKKVISEVHDSEVKPSGLRRKVAYRMMVRCPWLLRSLSPLYRPVRQLYLVLFGR